MYPSPFIPVLFLVYAVADCVLPTCPGLKRLLILCIRRPFFSRLRRFFQAISARSCAPFQFFTVQDLVRGECDVWYFTNMILLLFRFFLSPPSCGGAVGRVPSVGDLYPTDNSNYSVCASVDTLVVNCTFFIQHQFICVVRPFLWYSGFLYLVHSCIHQRTSFLNTCSP